MKDKFPKPLKGSVFYDNEKLYACLATHSITRGHSIVVWKKNVRDLHLLSNKDYDYLMDAVNFVRDAMLKTLKVSKVYLIYMDELKHVHWHLIPRYNKKGYDALSHKPKLLKNISLAKKIKNNLILK